MDAGFNDIVGWAATATPASIFGLLWWLERSERREKDKDNRDLQRECLTGINAAATAVSGLKDLITAGGRGA